MLQIVRETGPPLKSFDRIVNGREITVVEPSIDVFWFGWEKLANGRNHHHNGKVPFAESIYHLFGEEQSAIFQVMHDYLVRYGASGVWGNAIKKSMLNHIQQNQYFLRTEDIPFAAGQLVECDAEIFLRGDTLDSRRLVYLGNKYRNKIDVVEMKKMNVEESKIQQRMVYDEETVYFNMRDLAKCILVAEDVPDDYTRSGAVQMMGLIDYCKERKRFLESAQAQFGCAGMKLNKMLGRDGQLQSHKAVTMWQIEHILLQCDEFDIPVEVIQERFKNKQIVVQTPKMMRSLFGKPFWVKLPRKTGSRPDLNMYHCLPMTIKLGKKSGMTVHGRVARVDQHGGVHYTPDDHTGVNG